jgi:hypothetical protein
MPGTPVVLDSLGGLVSTTRPESSPEGASPRNWDCDFTVGRFFQRPGERNVYSYEGVSFGPNGGGAASGAGINPWSNPANILAEDGNFTDSTVGASGASSVSSTGATGSNSGTGQPWTNPGNIASLSAYASVVLGGSGTFAFIPNNTNTSVTQTGPGSSSNTSSIIACAAAAAGGSATVSGDLTTSVTATLGGGSATAYYMSDLQPTWTPIVGESTTVGPVPFSSVVNVSNLSTLQLKVVTMASAGPGGSCSVNGSITNCQAVISGTGILNSQTLVANLAGLSIPSGAAIVGVSLSFSGLYSGTLPTLNVALSVGTESDAVTLGTSSGSHSLGSSSDLWGYGSWTAATLSSLAVKFNATTTGSTSAFLNSLVVTVWYSYAGSGTTAKLLVTQFNFTLPSTASITGIVVNVKGYAPGAELFAQLLNNGVAVGGIKSVPLPTSNAYVPLGSETDVWDETWAYSDIDAVGFGVSLWATSATTETIALDYADIEVFGTEGSTNYTGLMSANIDSQDLTTLALDAMGLVWEEDVSNNPNVLVRAGLIPPVVHGSYMKGVDANGVAFMAYSDLTQGTSQPMQYNGQWCDRITQVGPGSAPVFTPVQSSADSFDISTITQPAQQVRGSSYFLQSAGPGNTTAGSNVTVYYSDSTLAGPDTLLQAAFNSGNAVYLYMQFAGTAIPAQGPYVIQVTSVGLSQPPGQPRSFYYFTYTLPTSAYQYFQGSTSSSYTVTYQQSLATMTTTAPVPGLAVGSQIVVTGVTPSSWNNTWTITESLNSGSVSINQTSVAGGVATYDYTLISGVAPSAGQLVTITGTLNDGGTLNGANLVIATATGGASGSFTVNVSQPNATAVAETGQATTAGTQFTFDPGTADVGTSTNPIFGNGTGGALTFSAAPETLVTAGTKQGSVFWITRNGAVSRPAFPVTFTVPSNTQSIAATLIPIGPPNIIARGITFTESGQNGVAGASFYTYDSPVKYSVNGIDYFASALIIPDNVTTSASFSFPDSVLLASDEIDIEGNNYFNLIELGSPTWMFQYANRMLYGLCQTKVQNFVNLTFDGGYNPATFPQPLGWTPIPPATGIQTGLVPSADFGTSLQILNTGGGTATPQILYYQSAYQDGYLVNILQPNTAYSVRLKGRSLSANAQVVSIGAIPFATGAFGDPVGVAAFTLNQGAFTIQTAALIPSLAVIPPTLQLAIEMGALAAGAGIQIDRIEVFPTERPVDTTTIWTSYAGNFEAVDIVTGQLGCGGDNPQATQGSYQILENLYIEKLNSRCVTQDSPNYEPNQWKVALCAQGVGSPGPNAFHSEEEFSISASRSGISLFDGGKPMPIARELQASGVNGSIWETINWNAGKTIWCRFSTTERKLYVGVPMITPNFWLPNDPVSTPTSPNIVLMCNFTGCPTAEELVSGVPVHTTMFGDLKALDMRRKWSPWHMPCPAAEFITRQDGLTAPLFLCNGINSSKIYELVPGAASGGQNTDDGGAISWLYVTSPWVKAKEGQQNPALGALRKIWFSLTATMEGIGQVAGKIYSNSLDATTQNTFTIPLPFTLSYPQQNDQERVIEIGGQRVFVEFSALSSGGYAEVGTITLDGEMDKNAPHRGVAS